MQLKSLRIFCEVVRAGSFSRAAEENGWSQSSASQVVHQLEEELGVELIDRSQRPWVLTPEGDHFHRGCRKIVRQYTNLESQVRSFHQEVAGRVRVASIYSVGLSHINQFVKGFLQRHPKAKVQVQYEHPDRVYELVERDVVDLGLVSCPHASRFIAAEPWREEAIVLACAPQNRLSTSRCVIPADLQGVDLIAFGDGLKIRRRLDRALSDYGVDLNVVMEFDNTEIMKRAIESNLGVGLLPEPTVSREVRLGTLTAIAILDRAGQPAMRRPLGIIHRRGKRLSTTSQRFMRELQECEPTVEPQPSGSSTPSDRLAGTDRPHRPLVRGGELASR